LDIMAADETEEPLHALGVRAWEALRVIEDDDGESIEIFLPDESRPELEAELARVPSDQLAAAVRSLLTVAYDLHSRGIEEPSTTLIEIAVTAKARLAMEKDPGAVQDQARQHQEQMAAMRGERVVHNAPAFEAKAAANGVPLRDLVQGASWRMRGR
jgi:hypothetical protein